jgi:hypothetical protein
MLPETSPLEMYASAAAIAREYSAVTGAQVDGALAVLAAASHSQAGPPLLDPLERMLAERVRMQPVPSLMTASHGERAGLVGTALLALREEMT